MFTRVFMRALPGYVRTALATFPTTDFQALAREADKVFLATQQPAPPLHDLAPLAAAARGARENASTTPARPHATSAPRQQAGFCRYHRKFGHLAEKCCPPCSFAAQGNYAAGARQ